MITYYSDKKVFKLDNDCASYLIGIYELGYVVNLYYGSPIGDYDLWDNFPRTQSASFSPSTPGIPEYTFSADSAPLEIGCNGSGDFRLSTLAVRNALGDSVTDLRYIGHEIYRGKPLLTPLPSVYTNCDDEADTLDIETEDAVTGLQVILRYSVFKTAITRSVIFRNPTDQPMEIERAMSLCLDLPSMDFDMLTLYGRHAKERTQVRRPLAHGLQGIQSTRGSSGHMHNPFVALLRRGADEDQGEVYGFNFVYSGNFEATAECDYNACTRFVMGINPTDFGWHLAPGDEFTAPEVVLVYTDKGLGEMSRIFHRLYNNNLVRGRWKKEKRPLLINSWEAAFFDFNTDKLVEFAEVARDLGIDMLVMDDGGFGRRNDDQSSLGDWYVNTEKLPGGLAPLIERVNALGLKFGIWYEPEMISPDSDLFRAHPDWCVHVEGREPKRGRNQYVLDMSRADVRENIRRQMFEVLSQNKIDYVKWDFNRNISDAGSALLPPERKKEFFHRFILGTYELMGELVDSFPDLLLENCSGGGGRYDPGMLYFSPQIWASDDSDPIERLSIQFGTSMCYPASTMGAHVSPNERTGYNTKGNVALWGTGGYELDPRKLTEADRALVKEQVKEYHKYYDLIRSGDLYRIWDPQENAYRTAWSFVSPDRSEALVTVVTTLPDHKGDFRLLKLKGLCPDAVYHCEELGRDYTGSALMRAGIRVSHLCNNQYHESFKLHFVRK